MASAPTPSTSTTSILKCPSCNFAHHFQSKISGKHFIQMNTAHEIFGVTAECPVCLDECSELMALQCGHILCKDDYQRMRGVMPTSFNSTKYHKLACDIFLRRSDATSTSLNLTFHEPTTMNRVDPPAGGLSVARAPFPPLPTFATAGWYGATTTTATTHSASSPPSQIAGDVRDALHGAFHALQFDEVHGAQQPVEPAGSGAVGSTNSTIQRYDARQPTTSLNDPFSAFGEAFVNFPELSAGGLSSLSTRPAMHGSTSSAILPTAGSEASRTASVAAPPAATRRVFEFGAAQSSLMRSATTASSSLSNLAAGSSRMNMDAATHRDEIRALQERVRQDAMRAMQDAMRAGQEALRAGQDAMRAHQDEMRAHQRQVFASGEVNIDRHSIASLGGPFRSEEVRTLMPTRPVTLSVARVDVPSSASAYNGANGGSSLSEGARSPLPTRRVTRSSASANVPSSVSATPRRSKRTKRSVPV